VVVTDIGMGYISTVISMQAFVYECLQLYEIFFFIVLACLSDSERRKKLNGME